MVVGQATGLVMKCPYFQCRFRILKHLYSSSLDMIQLEFVQKWFRSLLLKYVCSRSWDNEDRQWPIDLYTFLSDNDYGPLCMFAPVLSYVYVFVSAITLNLCTWCTCLLKCMCSWYICFILATGVHLHLVSIVDLPCQRFKSLPRNGKL